MSTLYQLINVFDRRHPKLCNPNDAAGLCCWASRRFCMIAPGAKVVHLFSSRRYYPNRVDEYPAKDPGYYHMMVIFRGVAIDWTRRQLVPDAPHPFIQSISELRRDWVKVAYSWEALGI